MWKWLIVILALIGAIGATTLTIKSSTPAPVPPPISQPVRNPFPTGISAAGIIEPASENVVIGVSDPGLVLKVFVKEGMQVKAGDPLFQIDTRSLEAQLVAAKANVASADAELQRILAYRRKEDEPALRAKVEQAQANVVEAGRAIEQAIASVAEQEWSQKDAEAKVKRLQATVKARATPEEELERAEFVVRIAEAKVNQAKVLVSVIRAREGVAKAALLQAQAELDLFLAGAWAPDVKKAQAAVDQAKAQVEQLNLEIARRTVRAPLNATVIRLNLREGEYAVATALQPESAPIVLGDLSQINVRADIDEFDAERFRPDAKAVAFLKGGADRPIHLEFSHIEPFIIPKRALTNSQRELVDVRVLQVVYKITDPNAPVYVGQQVDVFIEAPPRH